MSTNKIFEGIYAVKPIFREGQWLKKGHSGSFLFDNSVISLEVPIERYGNGRIITPLTDIEIELLMKRRDHSYSKSDLENNETCIWKKGYVAEIRKPTSIIDENTVLEKLDSSKTQDYLKLAVLRTLSGPGGSVAMSAEEKYDWASYRIYLEKEGHSMEIKLDKADKVAEIFSILSKIKSVNDLRDLLFIYWLENSKRFEKPPLDASKEWCRAKFQELIDNDYKKVYSVVIDSENNHYKTLVVRAINNGIIKIDSKHGFIFEDTPLGDSTLDVLRFFKNEKNQEIYLRIQNLINSKK